MFYDKFIFLCSQKGVLPTRAAIEAGISKSLVTKWKSCGVQVPSPDVLRKLSVYFGVPISELLNEDSDYSDSSSNNEKTPTENGEREFSKDDLKFALWGDSSEIDDADLADVLRYAAFIKERKKKNDG